MMVFILGLLALKSFALDFSHIPAANNIQESKQYFNARFENVLHFSADFAPGPFNRQNNGRFLTTAIARLRIA